MTGPKVCWAANCKKLFWAVYLVCYLLCLQCVYLSTVTHTRKFLHAAEVISGLTKVKGEEGDLIQNESQFNCVRKKDNSKKSICHQHSVYHVSKRKYQLSTPPTFFCAISAGWNRSWMLIDPFYFRLLLKQSVHGSDYRGSIDLVQISGPWTRLQGVHGPGPDKWSMDLVQNWGVHAPRSMFCPHPWGKDNRKINCKTQSSRSA